MPLDLRYVTAPSLEEYFVDKDTGLPLAGGIVTFYKDNDRTVKKDVFRITGSPPNYSYTPIANPMILSGVGTAQDDGDNIIPYFYPYDENGNVELYYITVTNYLGVPQFTREGWPNVGGGSSDTENVKNYVPNGQFLFHNNLPNDGLIPNDASGQEVAIAQGGWYFERSGNSATDYVTFTPFNSIIDNPTGNPKFACTIQCQTGGGDSYKRLALRFYNVNMFASDTQSYTFGFTARDNNPGALNANIDVIKYFGDGSPSGTEIVNIENINIPDSYTAISTNILFGTNETETLGDEGTDYVEIAISFPSSSIFSASLVDFVLAPGENVTVDPYPYQTNRETSSRSLTMAIPPDPDGMDLFLPLMMTREGIAADHSQIGKIFMSLQTTPALGELPFDNEKYAYDGYSDDGIPYRRLADVLWNDTYKVYRLGSGLDYATVAYDSGTTFYLVNNSAGAVTATTDGSTPTNFQFSLIHNGATVIPARAYLIGGANFYVLNTLGGIVTDASAGTSPFTINTDIQGEDVGPVPELFQVNALGGATITGGDYFSFYTVQSPPPGTVQQQRYVWYTVNGAGADPTPGGIGIRVNILSTDDAFTVAFKTVVSINEAEATQIIINQTGASINQNAFFTFTTTDGVTDHDYMVWYNKDGAGTQPATSAIPIEVPIDGDYTEEQIALATQEAVNKKYFGLPSLDTNFFRVVDLISDEVDRGNRFSKIPGILASDLDLVGSFQLDTNIAHVHQYSKFATTGTLVTTATAGATNLDNTDDNTQPTGNAESRPKNLAVSAFIKY